MVTARDAGSRARAGVLSLAHGEVRTPAFVPLATKGSVRGLQAAEVAALGYEMVLGNTFHLFLEPGHELIGRLGGLHAFMRWERPIITDSGGFQVFSMGHGTVADEIKGRAARAAGRARRRDPQDRRGGRAVPLLRRRERALLGPRDLDGGAGRPRLGHRTCLRRVHAVPRGRDYTARSTERTHRWLARCLAWHAARGPAEQIVYGIVQGGVHEDLRRSSAQEVAASRCGGIAIGGSLGRDKAQMYEVVGWAVDELGVDRTRGRATCWGSATSTTCCAASSSGSTPSTARCRLAWAATGWRWCPSPSDAGGST